MIDPDQTRVGRWIILTLAVVYSLFVAALGLELDRRDLQLVQTFDKFAGDWRIALGSPIALDQRDDIVIVLVNDDSLLDYESRSPIDRLLLAELVRAIDSASPKAIALDLIFDRKTRADSELLAAIANAKAPIVLGAIDERVRDLDGMPPCDSLLRQQDWLKIAGRSVGHLMLERKIGLLPSGKDNTIRLIAEPFGTQTTRLCKSVAPPSESLSDVIAQTVGSRPTPSASRIAWLRRPNNGYDLFNTLVVPRHDPAAARTMFSKLVSVGWLDQLKGRIVLIGAQMIDRDLHDTPLSVLEGSVPGVMIHAQALAQRLDGNRDIIALPWWLNLSIVALLGLGSLWLASMTRINPYGLEWGVGGFLLIGLTGLLVLRLGRVELPSIALATAWIGGGLGVYIGRHVLPRLGLD